MSKLTIFAIIDAIVLYGTSNNNLLLYKLLQSGLWLHMWLKLATNVNLNENENEIYTYIIHF
jgi:hypothetical protein